MNTSRAARFISPSEPGSNPQDDILDDLGADPLGDSGFEFETPDEDFAEKGT